MHGSPAMPRPPAASLVRRPVEVTAPDPLAGLRLRPLCASDRDEFIRVARLSKAHLDRWLPIHRTGESDAALFDRQLEMTTAGDASLTACRRIAVSPAPDGHDRILGGFNVISITRGLELSGDLNWWVAPDALRRGIARRALGLLIGHALGEPPEGLGLHLVRAYIQRGNAPSVRLAARLGLTVRESARSYIQTGDRWAIHDLYTRGA
jgi:RimJ/RimL family protein N-acetyltransferase